MTDEEIIRTYADMVYRIAYGYGHSETDKNDIFQNVFLTYFKKKRSFESEEHRKAWLIRVTINEAKDFCVKRGGCVSLDDAPQDAFTAASDETDESADLRDALTKLDGETRGIVYMYYYEDMSVGAIADVMRLNQNTVKTKLSRGRNKLKKFLSEGETVL